MVRNKDNNAVAAVGRILEVLFNLRQFAMYIPLKKGLTRHIVHGPREANCPNDNSRKKIGRPTRARQIT